MTLKDAFEKAAHKAVDAAMHPSDTAHHLADGAKHVAHDIAEKTGEVAHHAAEKVSEVAHNAAQNAGNVAGALATKAATSEAVHQIGGVAKAAIAAIEKVVE